MTPQNDRIWTREDLFQLKLQVKESMKLATDEIRKIKDSVSLFKEMKFGGCGYTPLGPDHQNIMEQINQSFTILMSCYAAEKHFPEATGFKFAFAAAGGRDMIVYGQAGEVVAEVEIFTAVRAGNNRKLRRDVNRLHEAEIPDGVDRVVCYSAQYKYEMKKFPDDKKVKVIFCPLDDFIEWIRE